MVVCVLPLVICVEPLAQRVRRTYNGVMAAAKPTRWNLRVAAGVDENVRAAAALSHENLTDFVARAASNEAARVLSERSRFELSDRAWDEFTALLERPAQDNPALRRLFDTPSVFDA